MGQQAGHDGTRNLTLSQAFRVMQAQKRIQRTLAMAAKAEADKRVSDAMHRSGVLPKFIYKKDFRAVYVAACDPWHGLHASHEMKKRCDFIVFCTRCGSFSQGYRTAVLRRPCGPLKSQTSYHAGMLDKLLRGQCPYQEGLGSGLHKSLRWPPCPLHIYEDSWRHTKCTCNVCRPPGEAARPRASSAPTDSDADDDTPRPDAGPGHGNASHGPSLSMPRPTAGDITSSHREPLDPE